MAIKIDIKKSISGLKGVEKKGGEVESDKKIKEGDEIAIDLDNGKITNKTDGNVYEFTPIPPFMQELVASGGLMNYAKKGKK